MSENHTLMKSSDFLAQVHELEQLKYGDGEALRRAEQQARDALARMKRESSETQQHISRQRQLLQQKLQEVENETIATLRDATISVEQARQRIGQLQASIKEVTRSISDIVESTKGTYANAATMYAQAKEEITASLLDPNYARFASNELQSINQRINLLSGKDLSGAAIQAEVQMIMTDIYLMDVIVSNKRVSFIQDQAEALRLAETLLAKARNVRENNREEVGNKNTRLMDIDFWTDGCFREMEQETAILRQHILAGQTDAGYSCEQQKKDVARLRELERIEDLLVADARAKMNLSYYRQEQGELIQEILETDHRYMLVAKGFAKGGDEREAYILRMRHEKSGAQIEVIINPGEKDGEADVYFRVDSTTYMDSATMASITEAIAKDLEENGVEMKQYRACHPEQMPQFQPSDTLDISSQARQYHGIRQRQPMAMPSA